MCHVTATVPAPLRAAWHENRRFGRRTTDGTACTQQKAEGAAVPSASYCILYLRPRSVLVVAAAVCSRTLGMTLRLFGQMIGLLLRALGRVLRVALGLFGRVLRLAGQLRRLALFARDLHLRLTAQAHLELLLMTQLLLGGVLLVPLLMFGGVLGAALVSLRALALDACVQLRAAGLDARRARRVVCAEVVVEVVAPLAHVRNKLGIVLLDAVDETVALDLEVGEHIVLGVAEQRSQLVRVALQMQQHLSLIHI